MAGAKEDESQLGTLLRVKRKRTQDPIEALIVHYSPAKKKKEVVSSVESKNSVSSYPSESTNSLFRFAGTLCKDGLQNAKELVANVRQASVKSDKNIQRIRSAARLSSSEAQKHSRYKVVSQRRQGCVSDVESEPSTPEDMEVERIFKIFDVINENDGESSPERESQLSYVQEGDLMCNSVKMFREKLSISDKQQSSDVEFVYDLYFADSVVDINGILDIEPFSQHFEELKESPDCFEDEDDENAEDNWRNDYPEDESDNDSSSSSKSYNEHYGKYYSSEDDAQYSGHSERPMRTQLDPYFNSIDHEDYYFEVASDND